MSTIGMVEDFIEAKEGGIDGILLSNGTIVETPLKHGNALVALVKRGDMVKVDGDEFESNTGQPHLRARKIAFSPKRESQLDEQQVLKSLAVKRDGEVEGYSMNANGDVNGIRFTDGTTVITPLRDGGKILAQLKPGDAVHVEGHRVISSRNDFKIIAKRIQLQASMTGDEFDNQLI